MVTRNSVNSEILNPRFSFSIRNIRDIRNILNMCRVRSFHHRWRRCPRSGGWRWYSTSEAAAPRLFFPGTDRQGGNKGEGTLGPPFTTVLIETADRNEDYIYILYKISIYIDICADWKEGKHPLIFRHCILSFLGWFLHPTKQTQQDQTKQHGWDTPLTSARGYCAAASDDCGTVVAHLHRCTSINSPLTTHPAIQYNVTI